ncbi:helix-turn-helix domain-containing protein [Bacillus cereus]|nr:helix-turn-helix domain-containing protein [Bacillus cereus]
MGNSRDAKIKKAVELYENKKELGLRICDIEEQTGIHSSTIYRVLRESDKDSKTGKSKIDQEKLNEALNMFINRKEQGLTVKDIVKQTGISKQTLYTEAKRRKMELEFAGRGYSKDSLEVAVEMYQRPLKKRVTLETIYKETGVSRLVLYKELESRGIEIRHGNPKSYDDKILETSIDMYLNRKELGMTVLQITEKTGICINALRKELRERGIIKEQPTRKYPKRLVNQAIELIISRRNKLTVVEVANQTGVGLATLYSELSSRGIRLREGKEESVGFRKAN